MNVRLGPTLGALVACLGAASVVSACEGSNTEADVPPLTGIRIDTLGLFGGDSCGTGPNQIAKIAITVERLPIADASTNTKPADTPDDLGDAAHEDAGEIDAGETDAGDAGAEEAEPAPTGPVDGDPLGVVNLSAVFDCFAEASFLDAFPEFRTYKLRVYGYSAAGYSTLETIYREQDPSTVVAVELRKAEADATLAAAALAVASCTAIQQPNARATAVCVLDRDSRTLGPSDAGSDAASDASDDGGLDASREDASDAGDAADDDASDASSDAGDAGDGGD